ncbi:hypothetical protein [Nocardia fluminea]|uniref:hypothetical protein n=1 Tax=Nocardia fluminea TaxID=134984 RepID=UPI0036558577
MNARARIGKVLRRWADRIDGSDMVPTIIKVPTGTLDQIRNTPAKPSPEFAVAIHRARARQQWAGSEVTLHNHTETDMCDDTCTTYGEGPTA